MNYIYCKDLNQQLEDLDRKCSQGKEGLRGFYENKNIIIEADGYVDYGRDLIIWKKWGCFRFVVLRAERDMNEWTISYLKVGDWVQSLPVIE